MSSTLQQAVDDINGLQAVFVTAMPDCLLYDSWVQPDATFDAEDVATYFGDLIRANRSGLKALGSWSAEMQVTIESSDKLIVLRELSETFVCSCVFDEGIALGMVRLHLRRLMDRLADLLPKFDVEQRPRGARIVEFLQRYAPDPHAVLLRVALRSGLSMEKLENPTELDAEEVEQLEDSARRILNLQTINV